MALTQVQSQMLGGSNPAIPTSVGVGTQALNSNSASNVTAVGYQAGYTGNTGLGNSTLIGFQAAYTSSPSSSAIGNTCVGAYSGYSLTTGTANTFVGGSGNASCGYYVTTGSKNTILGGFTGNQGGLDIRTASNYIVLSDGDGNPRIVANAVGDVFMGTTTPNAVDGSKLYVYYNGDNGIVSRVDSGNYCYVAHTGNGSNTGLAMSFRWTSTQVGRITTTSSATSYITSSDYRLKEDVVPMTGALAKVALLKPVTYKWKVDGSDGEGFIAHELAEVCPQAVSGEKDAVDAKGDPDYQGIDTSFLVATLTAAIQELNAKVTALEAQLAK